MRLKICKLDEIIVIGVPEDLDFDSHDDDYAQFYNPRLTEIEHVLEPEKIFEAWDSDGTIIGKRVSHIEHIPDGCFVKKIPAGEFAKLYKSQLQYELDMFARTNYIEEMSYGLFTKETKKNGYTQQFSYRPVQYSPGVVNTRTIPSLEKERSKSLKERYVSIFFDTESCSFRRFVYKRYITQDRGFLWELARFKNNDKGIVREGLSKNEAATFLLQKGEVLVFWEGYSTFGKEMIRDKVMTMDPKHLLENYTRFTLDMYIFDESLTWTVIFQHERDEDGFKHILLRVE
ncbi:hypothetical protein E8L90_01240 [Brevibacillus antibioticus]|uniref:Uncharacterized protein n=1 Tax=Brevibacillus antibioticus TaxID=2570228 RepID=A0A4U2Y1B5_9BACL|nr:hypothetical protein [Brevibacillus antibioticus]TKI54180.1 hypothetical protein E8L90_01240 [Brevibacillus antibioticus]